MALVNALLIRYRLGYTWVTDAPSIAAHGRREAYLALGSANSIEEVTRVGEAMLGLQAQPVVATDAELVPVDPGGADMPYTGLDVADWVTLTPDVSGAAAAMRIRALTISEDTEGNLTIVPELGSVAEESAVQVDRWLKRMANGGLGGTTESAIPPPPAPAILTRPGAAEAAPPFAYIGPLDLAASGRYYPPDSFRIIELVGSLRVAGSTDTIVGVYKNGALQNSLTIPASDNLAAMFVDIGLQGPRTDYLTMAITTPGTGAEDLTVLARKA